MYIYVKVYIYIYIYIYTYMLIKFAKKEYWYELLSISNISYKP